MAKIGGYMPDKKGQVKNAIKGLGKKMGLTKNTYYDLTNYQILVYMLQNRMGVRWITELSIKDIRSRLPKMYRRKD